MKSDERKQDRKAKRLAKAAEVQAEGRKHSARAQELRAMIRSREQRIESDRTEIASFKREEAIERRKMGAAYKKADELAKG